MGGRNKSKMYALHNSSGPFSRFLFNFLENCMTYRSKRTLNKSVHNRPTQFSFHHVRTKLEMNVETRAVVHIKRLLLFRVLNTLGKKRPILVKSSKYPMSKYYAYGRTDSNFNRSSARIQMRLRKK